MYRFIAHENIRRFRAQLENCPDERTRETLAQLLDVEQGKLRCPPQASDGTPFGQNQA